MLETFTPAVCGSRKRQIVAQALFAGAALASAALLGLVLGFAGSLLGAERAVLAAAALALLAAAREAGLVRLPLPQARRQVPERWRFELPLPVWATGYGAGLGAELFTFQPVSTFWVACAGAVAVASPVTAALCVSLYGAGRALMVVWPRRREADATAAVERLVGKRGALLRANTVVLVACGILLAAAPAAGGAVRVAQSAYDPSVHRGVLAFATQSGDVVVRRPGGPNVVFSGAAEPAIFRQYLAYTEAAGIRVVRWTDGAEIARINHAGASKPALHWPLLAYVRPGSGYDRLIVRNLQTGTSASHARVAMRHDLGRPSLRNGRLAWHVTSRTVSRVLVKTLASGRTRTVARSKVALLANPSISGRRIMWTVTRFGVSRLRVGWVARGGARTVDTVRSRTRAHWTTALESGVAYATRWTLGSGVAAVYRTRF
jgi:hypothetical protein